MILYQLCLDVLIINEVKTAKNLIYQAGINSEKQFFDNPSGIIRIQDCMSNSARVRIDFIVIASLMQIEIRLN